MKESAKAVTPQMKTMMKVTDALQLYLMRPIKKVNCSSWPRNVTIILSQIARATQLYFYQKKLVLISSSSAVATVMSTSKCSSTLSKFIKTLITDSKF